jgi:hypothetical protein
MYTFFKKGIRIRQYNCGYYFLLEYTFIKFNEYDITQSILKKDLCAISAFPNKTKYFDQSRLKSLRRTSRSVSLTYGSRSDPNLALPGAELCKRFRRSLLWSLNRSSMKRKVWTEARLFGTTVLLLQWKSYEHCLHRLNLLCVFVTFD